jgi:iron complex outermembrane receptor protein
MNTLAWRNRYVVLAAVGSALVTPVTALAQDDEADAEIVVTGTRRSGLSPTETLSPVDVLGGELLQEQGSFDLTESLTRINPALNTQRFPIADGTAFIRPVTLRNLSPDHTLVLMNGSRRHRSALVNLQLAPLGTVNQGSQAVDFAAFPAAAIERVEVLRDGASAQYGSDAIAGVINVILKDASQGFNVSTQYGEYYEGDGERWTISANGGLPLTADGFLNLTGEYSTSDITWRGNPRPDAAGVQDILGPGIVPLDGYGQRWGDPDVEAIKLLANAGIPLGEGIELYGHASYMDNETVSDFFYREPVLPTPADQLTIPARTTLQIDSTGPGGVGPADGLPDDASAAQVQAIIDAGGDPDDYLTPDGGSPSGYVLRNPIHTMFPGGYNPDFGADMTDMALALGVRGALARNLSWDVHGRYAENEVEYTLSDTINPSFGALSPTSFTPGTLTQEESGLNVDFVKTFEGSPLNIAFGAEWRNETYEIGAGDAASWQAGPTAPIFGVGSDGFQGFPVESAGEFESDSYAGYVDVETDLTERLSASIAARYEDYDEFDDSTFDWKVAGRYQVTDTVAVRATFNTAFRIPTPGQVHTLNVTTTANQAGDLIPNGTYPVDHPIAVALGAAPLEPEESDNYTAGIVWQPTPDTSVTLDYYHIEIDERIALESNTLTQTEVDILIAAGIPNAQLLLGSSANFFTNGFDSEVDGIDIAVTSRFDLWGGDLVADLRHNYNSQEISDVDPGTINASRVYDLENQVPENRAVLTLDWAGGALGALLRVNWFDDWSTTEGLFSPGDASDQYIYDSAFLVDVEARYTFAEAFTVAAGAENLFDEYPDDELGPVLGFLGVEDALTSPFGFNGGFWYLRFEARFGQN